ncbi:MAG: nucleoside hydrolase [Acidimicrobiales bacterium]|nr:nucleoside hydrolase [Acidimicrobiales bacterium]
MKPKIILDCDPGHDDAVAIMVAAQLTEILGITTVSGNVSVDLTTENALILAELVDLDAGVHMGANKPLRLPPKHAEEVHGKTGLDGPTRHKVTRQATSSDAVQFIIDTVREHDEVWLVPVGPLTNIAVAILQAPDIVQRVAGVSLMGGSAGAGNVTPVAEFNVWADPHAASVVFSAGFANLFMAGLNLTHQFGVDEETILRLREINNPPAVFAAELFDFYLRSYQQRTFGQQVPLHDPCAVLAITHPEIFSFESRNVSVETEGIVTRGMTVIDERRWSDRASNCQVGYEIDRDKGMNILFDVIKTYSDN